MNCKQRSRPRFAIWPLALLVSCLASCHRNLRTPDLGELYNQSAQLQDDLRNPVIVIPGILGSSLTQADTGRVVWGAFSGDYANPGKPDGARLLSLPMALGVPLGELKDDVLVGESLDRLRLKLFGLPLSQLAYAQILGALGVGGFRDQNLGLAGAIDYGDDHFTCFQFPYDWRRDLAENAANFSEFVREKKTYVEAEWLKRYGIEREARFDVVAHSMGGLLLRYWLRYGGQNPEQIDFGAPVPWTNAESLHRGILVGTPNAGAALTVEELVNGIRFHFLLPTYDAVVLGTMPAIYQLLPRNRHHCIVNIEGQTPVPDFFQLETWIQFNWGLADKGIDERLAVLLPNVASAQERRAIALDHLKKCLSKAEALQRALDIPAAPPKGTELFLVAGDAHVSTSRIGVHPDGELQVLAAAPGDSTVTRSSALMDERLGLDPSEMHKERTLRSPIAWSQVLFLFTDHLGLTKDPAFIDNVLYTLLERPPALR